MLQSLVPVTHDISTRKQILIVVVFTRYTFQQISLLLNFYRQITVYFTLLVHQAWCTNWQQIVFGIENYFDGIRYLYISPKNSGYGYDISIYRIL